MFVAERVGETFHRMPRRDRVSVQVQLAMQLDERHLPRVASEDREEGGAQVLALQRLCAARDRWERRRTTAMRDAEALHDVLGVDARPHDDAHLGQSSAHLGELERERLLRGVELCRPL
jgi:hypothetical protein